MSAPRLEKTANMPQLGAGFDSGYPNVVDTRQVFRNGTVVLPDSDTRLDSEVINDSLSAIVNIESTLGANVQGAYGSLAARLDALETGGSALTNVVAFTSQMSVLIPGSAHQQGQQALLYAVYDAASPRNYLRPDTFSVYPGTYNAIVTFAVPQSGVVMVAALTPAYVTTFATPATPPYSVTIPGSTHALAEIYLFVQAYDTAIPAHAIEIGGMSVNTTTFDVVLTFAAPQTGILTLAVGSPRYAEVFFDQTSVTIPGSVHGLASPNLLHQVYAPSGTDPVMIPAGGLSVHSTTFDVVLTFAVPQSGVLVLAPVPSVEPPTLLAVLPLARTVPAPVIATRTVVDERATAQLQARVEALTTRLLTLETAYQGLLAQREMPPPEEHSA